MREQVDTLNKTKFDRLKRLKRLAEMEIGLCKTIGEKAKLSSVVASKIVPSEQQLEEFRARINGLEKTRVRKEMLSPVSGSFVAPTNASLSV